MRSEHACHNREEGPASLSKDKDEGYGRRVDIWREDPRAD